MRCKKCQTEDFLKNAVVDGLFGGYCASCIDGTNRLDSPQSASYHRDRDREEHARDVLQPRINGKMNVEFAKAYPDQAKEYFTEEELKEI